MGATVRRHSNGAATCQAHSATVGSFCAWIDIRRPAPHLHHRCASGSGGSAMVRPATRLRAPLCAHRRLGLPGAGKGDHQPRPGADRGHHRRVDPLTHRHRRTPCGRRPQGDDRIAGRDRRAQGAGSGRRATQQDRPDHLCDDDARVQLSGHGLPDAGCTGRSQRRRVRPECGLFRLCLRP